MVFTACENSLPHQLIVCIGMHPIRNPRNLHDYGGGIIGQHYTDNEFRRTFKIEPPLPGEEFWLMRTFPQFHPVKLEGFEHSGGSDGERRATT